MRKPLWAGETQGAVGESEVEPSQKFKVRWVRAGRRAELLLCVYVQTVRV